jgi:hypothetical protein
LLLNLKAIEAPFQLDRVLAEAGVELKLAGEPDTGLSACQMRVESVGIGVVLGCGATLEWSRMIRGLATSLRMGIGACPFGQFAAAEGRRCLE